MTNIALKSILFIFLAFALLTTASAATFVNESHYVNPTTGTDLNIVADTTCVNPACTITSILYDDTINGPQTMNSLFYTQTNCQIIGKPLYNNSLNFGKQQLVNQTSVGDADATYKFVYTGAYDCGPPASTRCENTSYGPGLWNNKNWSDYFNMTYDENSGERTYVSASWIYPTATTINSAKLEVKYLNTSGGTPVSVNMTLPWDCLNSGTTGTTVSLTVNQTKSFYFRCTNNGGYNETLNGSYSQFFLYDWQMWWNVTDETVNPYLYNASAPLPIFWVVDYTNTCTSADYCNGFTRTVTRLVPGFMALFILFAGGIPLALGFTKNSLKMILLGFVLIILGIVLIQPISDLIISTC